MLTLSVETLLGVTGGELLAGSSEVMLNGVCTDSRCVHSGSAYVAFAGERVDGHDFCEEAVSAGARALLVTRSAEELETALETASKRGVAVVRVADSLGAVQALAAFHRDRLFCPVVGVTGSSGKTTTKEFIRAALGADRLVVATRGNRNNELGVPLTILEAGADTDVLVVEMGMRGPGQIADLCRIARPTVGLVTNVGTSHIEVLGTQEAIASAKGELIEAVPPDGASFLNGDDGFSQELAGHSSAPVVRYGLGEECEVRASGIELDAESRASFVLCAPGVESVRIALTLPGRHNVYNALAAAAVAIHVGVPVEVIAEGLASASAGEMRMQSFTSAAGIDVINDAYNANPASMRVAVDTLAGFSSATRRIAVLGDMAELGSLTELAHFGIGEQVAGSDVDVLVTVGERAARIADGARAAGMPGDAVRPCATPEEASEVLDDLLESGDVVLVKASRVMGLERVVEGIVDPRV